MVLKQITDEEPKVITQVVFKLPVQEVREMTQKDGSIIKFITVEEFLTGLANGSGDK